MSRLILNTAFGSPPGRSVMMLAELLGLKLEYKEVNLLKKEHTTPEFLKLNPMGKVPVLQDGDFVLSESHAILKYLSAKYGAETELYPSDLRTRAIVDQTMFFNAAILFNSFINVTMALLLEASAGPTPGQLQKVDSALSVVDTYLQNRKFIAADHLTLADLSAGTTATAIEIFHKVDPDKYPRCVDWIARLKEERVFKTVNAPGVAFLTKVINKSIQINKANRKL